MSFPRPTQPQTPPQHTVEITILSAKHLKNVNWKSGPLKPYVIFWVDPDHKLTTKSDDFSNTKPVWNQRFSLPGPAHTPLSDVVLTLELFHSKSSETPKPYIGSAQVRLGSFLTEPGVKSFDLLRPSGRPQGKIKLNVVIKEVDYQFAPGNPGYFYSSTPNPNPNNYSYGGYSRSATATPYLPPVQTTENYSVRTGYPHSMGYYPGFYSPPPPNPPPTVMRSFSDRNMSYGTPSAPVDYSPYEVRSRAGVSGHGVSGHGFVTGLGVGAVAGGLGGLALDDGLKYEESKIAAERGEDNYLGSSSIKDDFSEYGAEY